uniref:Secreted protein n=1 Tax=Steinernema glaseri TaxID=37863 RepID=A0A1I8A4M7_9BILA
MPIPCLGILVPGFENLVFLPTLPNGNDAKQRRTRVDAMLCFILCADSAPCDNSYALEDTKRSRAYIQPVTMCPASSLCFNPQFCTRIPGSRVESTRSSNYSAQEASPSGRSSDRSEPSRGIFPRRSGHNRRAPRHQFPRIAIGLPFAAA